LQVQKQSVVLLSWRGGGEGVASEHEADWQHLPSWRWESVQAPDKTFLAALSVERAGIGVVFVVDLDEHCRSFQLRLGCQTVRARCLISYLSCLSGVLSRRDTSIGPLLASPTRDRQQ